MRDATDDLSSMSTVMLFQSTHPMRDATLSFGQVFSRLVQFQSTHPMRDATFFHAIDCIDSWISIHASHAGCDFHWLGSLKRLPIFQSTHPMRDATLDQRPCTRSLIFQSTHPMRDATSGGCCRQSCPGHISIHASHAGCDPSGRLPWFPLANFNPRIPCGMRL